MDIRLFAVILVLVAAMAYLIGALVGDIAKWLS